MDKILLKKIAIMQAYLNGKAIEFGNYDKNEESYIECCHTPSWNWEKYDYRIKKESSKKREDNPIAVGYMKINKFGDVSINTTFKKQLDPTIHYLVKVYKIKEKDL
jgi:hypothetical protein